MDQQHDDPTTRPLRLEGRGWAVGIPTGGRSGGEDRGSTTYRYVVVGSATLVALAVVALAGVLLYPRVAPVAATVAAPAVAAVPVPSPASTSSASTSSAPAVVRVPSRPRTVVVPAPTTTAYDVPSGGYSCGSVDGYAIQVNNGNVPCTSARLVTEQWTSSATTPMNGEGDAGTPYSWTCTSASPAAVGFCISKLGSTFTIDP